MSSDALNDKDEADFDFQCCFSWQLHV